MRSIFYGRQIPTEVFSSVRGKIKVPLLAVNGKFGIFSRDFDDFKQKIYRLCKEISKPFRMSEEKKNLKKKAGLSTLFPVGNNLGSSENHNQVASTF